MTHDSDFVTRLGLSDTVKAIIDRTAKEFEEVGDWVTFNTLAYEAADRDAPFDLNEVFRLPSVLGGSWAEEKVSLTGLGLLVADTAPRTAETMTRLAMICAERKMRLRDEATVGEAVLTEEYEFPATEARQAQKLVSLIPGVSSGGSLGDNWS